MERRAQMTVQTFMVILMGIFFVWLLVFGIQKIFFVQDILSKQELVELQKQVEKAVKYCDDPLSSGSQTSLTLAAEHFNSICIIGDTFPADFPDKLRTDLKEFQGSENVVLLKTSFLTNSKGSYTLDSYGMVGKFGLDYSPKETVCYFNYDNSPRYKLVLKCD